MRYSGTDCALMCTAVPQKPDAQVNVKFLLYLYHCVHLKLGHISPITSSYLFVAFVFCLRSREMPVAMEISDKLLTKGK